jgi:acetyl-CoA carboxylase biotin carboxyl carrier protein
MAKVNHTLVARIEPGEEEGTQRVLAPAVGILDRVPATGVFINPLQTFMSLTILGRRHAVQLPHDVHGWVGVRFVEETWVPVDYGRPLFELDAAQVPGSRSARGSATGAPESSNAGLVAVRSPSQGVFYRRSGPDNPPYVEVGSEVVNGTVLGLVEVMKCFNQIAYGGPGLPERGAVEKILIEDAEEVSHDQVMFWIRPL